MGSIFNIVGCSAALICHFVGNPIAHPKFRGLFHLLLNGLNGMPRAIALRDLRKNAGHSYTFTLDEDLLDDVSGSSSIVLFEDGKSLPRWHCRDGNVIATEGRGAYVHVGRTLYFSTSDNSSPLTNGRKYTAIQSYTADPAVFGRLMNWRKTTTATGAAQLFEMLRILWPRHFGYAAASGTGPEVTLSDPRLAIDEEAQMRLVARSLSARPVAPAQWAFEIAALSAAEAPDEPWSLRGRIDLWPSAHSLLPSLGIEGPGGFFLSLDHPAAGRIAMRLGQLEAIKAMLVAAFGDTAALGKLARLITAPLSDGGFGLTLDQEGTSALAQIFSDAPLAQEYELTVEVKNGGRHAVLRQVSHDR